MVLFSKSYGFAEQTSRGGSANQLTRLSKPAEEDQQKHTGMFNKSTTQY